MVTKNEVIEDVSLILYILPFIVSASYAIVLWAPIGISSVIPAEVYFIVTRDPLIFLTGFLSILLALIIEVYAADPSLRQKIMDTGNTRLQKLAIASLILAGLTAWSAAKYGSIAAILPILLDGKYTLIYPFLLLLTSFLLGSQFRVRRQVEALSKAYPMLLMIIAPMVPLAGSLIGIRLDVSILLSLLVFFSGLVKATYDKRKFKTDESDTGQ